MNEQEKGQCSIPAEPCRERAGQRGNNDDEVIRPSSKKVSLYKRERLRWERFHRRKSKLFSEQVDVIIGQLSIAEILSCIPLNGSDAPISQISFQSELDNLQRTSAQGIDRCLLRNAISLVGVLFNFAPAAHQKTVAELLGVSLSQIIAG